MNAPPVSFVTSNISAVILSLLTPLHESRGLLLKFHILSPEILTCPPKFTKMVGGDSLLKLHSHMFYSAVVWLIWLIILSIFIAPEVY